MRFNRPVPSVRVEVCMPVNIRTMHLPVSQPPPENCCCYKPYKHQMPTLKGRSDILFIEQETTL